MSINSRINDALESFGIACVVAIAAIVVASVVYIFHTDKVNQCAKKGGIIVRSNYSLVCIKAEVIK
jgi:phosphatidylserine decarboxylase